MATVHLTDEQWAFIEPLLPPQARTGRPRANERRTVEGHSLCADHGVSLARFAPRVWHADDRVAPAEAVGRGRHLGVHLTHRTFRLDVQGKLDWSMAFLDGSFAPAEKGGENVGLTRKGKWTIWMLVVDGNGLPLGFHLDGANRAEVRLAEQTLVTIRVARPRGRPKQRPEKLVADRGYDGCAFHRVLRGRGIRMCIPSKRCPKSWKAKRGRPVVACKDDYRLRFKVERSFAWLGNFRLLLIRWERLFDVYRSWFTVAVLLLRLRRVASAG